MNERTNPTNPTNLTITTDKQTWERIIPKPWIKLKPNYEVEIDYDKRFETIKLRGGGSLRVAHPRRRQVTPAQDYRMREDLRKARRELMKRRNSEVNK